MKGKRQRREKESKDDKRETGVTMVSEGREVSLEGEVDDFEGRASLREAQ